MSPLRIHSIPLILIALLAQPALADPNPEEEELDEDDGIVVDVEASREVGAKARVTRAELEDDALSDLPEVLDEQPGLRITRIGGLGSFSALSIRGSTPEQVRVFLDGIPLNSAQGGPVDLGGIALGPVESIVVYRGFAPVIFGGSAIGGVVDIQTRLLLDPHVEAEVGAGSFGTRTARGFVGAGDARWGAGASVDALHSDGDFTFTNDRGTLLTDTDDDSEVRRQNNAFDQVTVMGKGQLSGSGWSLSLLDLMTWRDQGIPGLGLFPTEEAHLTRLRNLLGARLDLYTDALEVTVTPYLVFAQVRFDDPLSEVGLGADATQDQTLTPGASASITSPLRLSEATTLTLTLATDARHERFKPGEQSTTAASPSARTFATAAGEGVLSVHPASLALLAAARHESAWSRLEDPARSNPALDPDARESDVHLQTWRVGAVWSGLPDTDLHLNLSRSARLPSLFELFGNTGAVVGDPSLAPETGRQLDLGAIHEATWLPEGNRLRLEAFLFASEVEELIQFVQNAQGVAIAENVDSASLRGAELGALADLGGHLRARSSLTRLHTENTGDVAARRGKRLPSRPRWQAYQRLTLYTRLGGDVLTEVGASGDLEYVSGNVLDNANLVQVPERWIWGAGAYAQGWRRQLRADVTLRNLTSNTIQDLAGYPLPGFSVMATLRYTPTPGDP